MDSIQLMIEEHYNILRMTGVVRKACARIVEGGEVVTADFRQFVDFVRNYADKHHHGKEEQILFEQMQANLGRVAVNLVKHGMLVEHDLGRLLMYDLELALNEYDRQPSTGAKLDILSNALGYNSLIARHIAKENDVVFCYARNNLSRDVLGVVDAGTEEFERLNADTPSKYLAILSALEAKYN